MRREGDLLAVLRTVCGLRDRRIILCVWAVLLAFTLGIVPHADGQQGQLATPPQVLKVTTELVVVDVVVKDKKGKHVKGLGPADFTVLDDQKPQKVSLFSYEDIESPGLNRKTEIVPPNFYSNRPEYRVPLGPLTVLLLDALSTPWSDQAYMRYQMLRYVDSQGGLKDRIAVIGLGDSVHVLQDFTDDPRILKTAIESYRPKKSTQLMIGDMERRLSPPSRMFDTPSLDSPIAVRVGALEDFYSHQAELSGIIRVRTTLEAMRAIGRTLAGYPGRKNLIWVSAAFPLSLPSTGASIGGTLLTGLLRETTETLTNARVAIYPIDARGLVGTTIFDASRSGTKGLGHAMTGPEFAASVNQEQATLLDPQGTMEDIANWTGGLAFINRNDLGHALEESLADGSSYYALGFYRADQTHDGKFHKLEVRLDRRDCEVRYRHGYYAVENVDETKRAGKLNSGIGEADAELMLAMKPDTPLESTILFDARVSARGEGDRRRVPIELMVYPAKLSPELLDKGAKLYRVSMHVAAYGPDGRLVTHRDVAVNSKVSKNEDLVLQSSGLPLHTNLELPRGRYHLRIGIRDLRTGHLGTVDAYSVPD
jgi:VWFA-related protein